MQKVPYHNTGATTVYVGGVAIPPGSAREVDARLVPGGAAGEETQPRPPEDPLLELLEGTVKDVENALGGLSDEDLIMLELHEGEGKKRVGVFRALEADRLRRAQEDVDAAATRSGGNAGDGDGDAGNAGNQGAGDGPGDTGG